MKKVKIQYLIIDPKNIEKYMGTVKYLMTNPNDIQLFEGEILNHST